MTTRRNALIALTLAAGAALLAGCAALKPAEAYPPIVFVHGNGDTAALWQTTIWRFESNGWPADRLHAIDVPYPLSRDDDGVVQAGRTSAAEHMAYLKAEVDRVLVRTGARQVVLVANSRGGNAVRNYIANGGGDQTVSHAVLGGTPNHGVWAIPGFREGNEFSGTGPFLKALNAPKNAAGDEVAGPVKWLTIRSDANDKFATPDGLWIGQPGKPTGVTAEGPALQGATNIVIPRADHRETSFSPAAFDATWRFVTGGAPRTTAVVPQATPVLAGKVTGIGPAGASNLPIAGAQLDVYATDPTTGVRLGAPVHARTLGADGRWGPFTGAAGVPYEFVVTAPGYATTHIYRSAFARSSDIVNLRPERIAEADRDAKAVVILTRPRGYFDRERDTIALDGSAALPGVPAKGAGVSASKLKLADAAPRPVTGEFNGERVVGQVWPMAGQHVTVLELTY